MVQHQENVSSVHKVKNVSLVSLCRHLELGGSAEELARHKTKRDQRFWLRRPIEHEALYLAALEVTVLANMLYPKLKGWVENIPKANTITKQQQRQQQQEQQQQ